jgi:hypothetical protein
MTLRETIVAAIMGLPAFVGLALASSLAHEPNGLLGYGLVVIGVAAISVMIHRSTGRPRL